MGSVKPQSRTYHRRKRNGDLANIWMYVNETLEKIERNKRRGNGVPSLGPVAMHKPRARNLLVIIN